MFLNSRKVNNDPHPNVWFGHSGPNRMRADTDVFRAGAPSYHPEMDYRYSPRPEYDNNPNPILVAFRESEGRNADAWLYMVSSELAEPASDGWYYEEHLEHAAKVLERLANLYNN